MCLRATEVRTGPVVAPPPAGSSGNRGPTQDGGTLGISTSTTVWVHICVCVRFKLAHGGVNLSRNWLSLLTPTATLIHLSGNTKHWRTCGLQIEMFGSALSMQ